MAKNKPRDDDFSDAPPDAPGAGGAPADLAEATAERDLLRERVAQLEARLEAQAAAAAQPAAPAQVGTGYWRVTLEGAPTHVVAAPDNANAWQVYCAEMGVIGSIHSPQIEPADREAYRAAQARRHGKKPEEFRLADDPPVPS